MIDYTPRNVTDYHKVFIDESKQLIEIFRNEIVEIHHFGSTAVQGLPGHQSLDILPVVKNLDRIDRHISRMEDIGFKFIVHPEYEEERCKVFERKIDGLKRLIIMVERTDFTAIDRRLAVRDYLRVHQDVKKEYAELKMRLAQLHADDYERYAEAKIEYINSLEQDAMIWYRSLHS